jgi:hypothetical protein
VETGEKLWEKRIDSRDPQTKEQPKGIIRSTDMLETGALADVLSADGASLFMRQARFGRKGAPQEPDVPHLYSPAGFLDDAWWHRTYWIYGSGMGVGYGGWPRVGNQVPAGRILVCDDSHVYGFGRDKYATHGSHVGVDETRYLLFAAGKLPETVEKVDRKGKKVKREEVRIHWSRKVPLIVRAMVCAGERLFLTGPPEGDDGVRGLAGLDGSRGAVLYAVSARDGVTLADYDLESLPVFDGMIAANGRLYLATKEGKVLCYAGR